MATTALDIIKNKTGLNDAQATEALKIKNTGGAQAFLDYVAKNKPVPTTQETVTQTTDVTPNPSNKEILAQNQANRQAMIQSGEIPAVGQKATVTPPTVTPTPEQTPIENKPTTVTPEPVKTPKVEAPIDYTQAKGREQDIINNLNTFKAQGMTPDQIMKASDYANATPEKKALIEPYLKQSPITASSLYNLIASKQEVPLEQKSSGAYRVANNRYQRVNQYVNMTPTEVNQAFTSGKLVEGSQTFEDLKSINPKLVQDAVNLRKVNGNKTNIFTYTNNPDGTPVKTNNLEKQFTEQYSEDHPDIIELLKSVYNTPTYAQMQAQINTPEVKAAQDKASEIENEMNSLQTAMDSVDKDVDAELKGSGATSSRIALEKSSRKAELQKQYDAKLRDYTTQYNKATNLINQNTEMFKYTQEQNKAMQTALAGVYTKQYENQLALQQNQAEYDQKIKQQAQAMGTPELAIPEVINQYASLGIMASVSPQEHITRAKQFIANGGTLGEYISQMQKDFQEKDAYKAKFATTADKPFAVAAGSSVYDPVTKTFVSATGGAGVNYTGADLYKAMTASSNPIGVYATGDMSGDRHAAIYNTAQSLGLDAFINQYQGTKITSDMVNQSAQKFGVDPLMIAATMALDSSMGTKGLGAKNNNPGNVGQFDSLGTKGVVGYPTLQDGIDAVANNLAKRQQALGANGQTGGFSQAAIDAGQAILAGDAKLSDLSGKSNEALKIETIRYIAQKNKTTQNTNVAQIQDSIKLVDSILNHPGLEDVVGLKNPFTAWTPGTDAQGFKAKLDQLTATNFMVGIKSMKGLGSLSDAEGSKVSASVSSLANTSQNEAEFRAELQRLKDVLKNRLTSTEKETGITYDDNGYAITPGQQSTQASQSTGTPYIDQAAMDDLTNSVYGQ